MFLHVENFNSNADELFKIFSSMTFESALFGDEVKNFNHTPQELINVFQTIVRMPLQYGENSGTYRKPHTFIHYENFQATSVYVAYLALEDNNVKIYQHNNTNAYHVLEIQEEMEKFIPENCFDESKWNVVADIKLKKGNLLLVQPFQFHSLEKKLVQVFYLERQTEGNIVPTEEVASDAKQEQIAAPEEKPAEKPKRGRKKKS
jgi:hypothetical protein